MQMAEGRLKGLLRQLDPNSSAAKLPAVTSMEIPGQGAVGGKYYTIREAVNMGGVRWSGVPECPAPISEPLKQMLWIKRIPAARVEHASIVLEHMGDQENAEALVANTAQSSWPVLWYEDERPRSSWLEQLEVIERIGAPGTPVLLPSDPADHAVVIGMVHLIQGERGFFWMRRLLMMQRPGREGMATKYGHPGDVEAAPARVRELLGYFDGILHAQQQRGSRYLVGDAITAADVFLALAIILAIPPSRDLVAADTINAHNPEMRTASQFVYHFMLPGQGNSNIGYETMHHFESAVTDRLRKHQDYIIRTHCNIPLK